MSAAPDQIVDQCPFEPVVDLVLGRWTSHVLWTLATKGRLRFSELHAQLPAVTPRVLTERLRKLESDGFLRRSYYREIPPRVEYEITPLAETLIPRAPCPRRLVRCAPRRGTRRPALLRRGESGPYSQQPGV